MKKKRYTKGKIGAVLLSAMLTMSMISGCQSSSAADSGESEANVESGSSVETAAATTPASATSGSVDTSLLLSESTINTTFTDNEKNAAVADSNSTAITLKQTSSSVSGDGASADGSTVTITAEGTYAVSGTLTDGQIIVDAQNTDKVWIILDGADINCETSAAIYVKQADKVFLTQADGSENTLSGGTEYASDEDNTVDGVIFSADDLCINGSGSMKIDANYKHGIVSKDDLVVTGGVITIDAVSQCLAANDEIRILDGDFTLTAAGKGMKAENDEDTTLGNIYIAGGTFIMDVEDDAVHAGGSVQIDDGTFIIDSGDDGVHAELDTVINGGKITINSCYEGLEGKRVTVNDGVIELYASDDGINAASSSSAGESTDVPGGVVKDGTMPEEGSVPTDGTMPESAEMPADGTMPDKSQMHGSEGFGKRGGQLPNGAAPGGGDSGMDYDSSAYIAINGGTITVNALGDAIDSNGAFLVTGGTTYVNGPTNSGNGSLDYNGSAAVTGGTLIAAGSSGMATTFTSDSTQYSFMEVLGSAQEAETEITLKDSEGNVVLSYTPIVCYDCVIITSPELEEGETYTLTTGDDSVEITLDSVSVSNKSGGIGMRG